MALRKPARPIRWELDKLIGPSGSLIRPDRAISEPDSRLCGYLKMIMIDSSESLIGTGGSIAMMWGARNSGGGVQAGGVA